MVAMVKALWRRRAKTPALDCACLGGSALPKVYLDLVDLHTYSCSGSGRWDVTLYLLTGESINHL